MCPTFICPKCILCYIFQDSRDIFYIFVPPLAAEKCLLNTVKGLPTSGWSAHCTAAEKLAENVDGLVAATKELSDREKNVDIGGTAQNLVCMLCVSSHIFATFSHEMM